MSRTFKVSMVLFAWIMVALFIAPLTSSATSTIIGVSNGDCGCPLFGADYDPLQCDQMIDSSNIGDLLNGNETSSLPSSVDLMTSSTYGRFFPTILSQGNTKSCVGYSVLYTEFSYNVNKYYNRSSTLENEYSPTWGYNLACIYADEENAPDSGMHSAVAYDFLRDHGNLKRTEFDHRENPTEWSATSAQMREALKTRVSGVYGYTIDTISPSKRITSVNDVGLTMLKTMLNNGYVIRVSSPFRWDELGSSSNTKVLARCHERDLDPRTNQYGRHSFLIVGYDDNKSYDLNGNGTRAGMEYGAFKILNTYYAGSNHNSGMSTGHTGWVMYDALNYVSAVSKNSNSINTGVTTAWDYGRFDASHARTAAFTGHVPNQNPEKMGMNIFNMSEVEARDPVLLMEYDFDAQRTNQLKIEVAALPCSASGNHTCNLSNANWYEIVRSQKGGPYPHTGPIILDCASIVEHMGINLSLPDATDMQPYIRNYCFVIRATDVTVERDEEGNNDNAHTISDTIARVKDINGNHAIHQQISYSGALNDSYFYYRFHMSFLIGDVNRNGRIDTGDAALVLNYTNQSATLTSLQVCLADFNGDGLVDSGDASAILNATLTREMSGGIDY